jgi:hypothetical protein
LHIIAFRPRRPVFVLRKRVGLQQGTAVCWNGWRFSKRHELLALSSLLKWLLDVLIWRAARFVKVYHTFSPIADTITAGRHEIGTMTFELLHATFEILVLLSLALLSVFLRSNLKQSSALFFW